MKFASSRDLYHGRDTLEAPETLTGKKAIIIVGGGSMKRFGFLDKVADYLKGAGMEAKLFEGIESDSFADAILKSAAAIQEFEPNWIVAVGSGSPIDAIKAMQAFYEYPDTFFEDLITPSSPPTLRIKARFYTISPTSGTATEVTVFSAITNYEKSIKYPLVDFNIAPDVVVVGPALAETMPGKPTARTGMDAMTHVIETYASTLYCEYTDPLALHAIEMINKYLTPSHNRGMEAHDKTHDAQCLAGVAFSNVLLGIVHPMVRKTGVVYSGGYIVHGRTNAMYLPKAIKFNSKEPGIAAGYAKIAKFISLPGTTEEGLTDVLTARFLEMNKAPNIPACMEDCKDGTVDEKEFMDKLLRVAGLAIGGAYTSSNPESITPRVMEQLLERCYYDEEMDF